MLTSPFDQDRRSGSNRTCFPINGGLVRRRLRIAG
jgi:hypothetical protein